MLIVAAASIAALHKLLAALAEGHKMSSLRVRSADRFAAV
jgi:hypothetical protein